MVFGPSGRRFRSASGRRIRRVVLGSARGGRIRTTLALLVVFTIIVLITNPQRTGRFFRDFLDLLFAS
ncbi:MAG: hypothetical protein QG608_1298 [Actinomycetota bacterium]|nr:hypothetical protein [Actinomycetota bacterium]